MSQRSSSPRGSGPTHPPRSGRHRASLGSLLVLLLLVLGLPGLAGAAQRSLVDTVVRFVNGEPMTLGEVRQRALVLQHILKRQGQDALAGVDPREWERALLDKAVAELTDELLLEQESLRLKLPIDEKRLRREIQEEVLAKDRFPRLEQQLEELQMRQRNIRIQNVIRFFAARLPPPSPQELMALATDAAAEQRRPASVRLWRIVDRAADARAFAGLRRELSSCVFQKIAADPALAAAVDDSLREAYKIADDDRAACALLAAAVEKARDLMPADPPKEAVAIMDAAQVLLDRWNGVRDPAAVRAGLERLRTDLLALDDPAARLALFQERARVLSKIPREAGQGGAVGLVEEGQLGQPWDEAAFALAPGEPSAVIEVGDAWGLLFASEVREAVDEDPAVVLAGLRSRIDNERRDQVRKDLLVRLRAEGDITNAIGIDLQGLLDSAASAPR